jgi:hypothetical protein
MDSCTSVRTRADTSTPLMWLTRIFIMRKRKHTKHSKPSPDWPPKGWPPRPTRWLTVSNLRDELKYAKSARALVYVCIEGPMVRLRAAPYYASGIQGKPSLILHGDIHDVPKPSLAQQRAQELFKYMSKQGWFEEEEPVPGWEDNQPG